jgi:hypothetical protein
MLAADGCEQISITAENSHKTVRGASGFLRVLSVAADREKP